MAMATPAAVTLVRNGRRRHSLRESWVQVTLFKFEGFGRLQSARPPRRIQSRDGADGHTDQNALQQQFRSQGKKRLSGRERNQTLHEVFHAVSRRDGEQNTRGASDARE